MKKLTKENVYIDLRGKSKDELTELYHFLNSIGEKQYRTSLRGFLENYKYYETYNFNRTWTLGWHVNSKNKQEVTIAQLKQIIKPMETFTPIAMKCTQEQFEAIKPKLKNCRVTDISGFYTHPYLINYRRKEEKNLTNYFKNTSDMYGLEVHEEWNEEIFLKACGIETEPTLAEQLEKAEAEVKRLKEAIDDSKIKEGDWCTFWDYGKNKFIIAKFQGNKFACVTSGDYFLNCEKITNPELIKLLEDEIK